MKKTVFLLVLAILVTGSVFVHAQESTLNNWISGEIGLFNIGVRYEYQLDPKFSVGANAFANSLFFTASSGVVAFGRFFPTEKSFFLELGLGYGSARSASTDIKYVVTGTQEEKTWGGVKTTGFMINPGFGWRVDVGETGGFFIQPGFRVPIVIGKQEPWEMFSSFFSEFYDDFYKNNVIKPQSGISVDFNFYFGMGVAF